jgi:hypothetical protein
MVEWRRRSAEMSKHIGEENTSQVRRTTVIWVPQPVQTDQLC